MLRSMAAARGLTVSDCLRGMVAKAVADPLPTGRSMGHGGQPLIRLADGRYGQAGAFWSDGSAGLERTICVSEPGVPGDETRTYGAFSPRQP